MKTIRNKYPKTIRYPSFCGGVSETGIRYPRETHGWELYSLRITAPVNREVDPLDAHLKVDARYFRTNHLEKVDSLARDLQIAVKHHYPDCMQGKGRISPTVCGVKGGGKGGRS